MQEEDRRLNTIPRMLIGNAPHCAVAGHILAGGFAEGQSKSLPVWQTTAPGEPDPAATPHRVAQPVGSLLIHSVGTAAHTSGYEN